MSSSRSRVSLKKNLPVDVVEEVLLRLPVKHVLRCKLLSKTFYHLINTPVFRNKHVLFHCPTAPDNQNIIATVWSRGFPKIAKTVFLLPSPLDVYIPPPARLHKFYPRLIGCSNGLLCAEVYKELKHFSLTRFFLLWNPTTREHMILPQSKFPYTSSFGFGYNVAINDYKLVKIWCNLAYSRLEVWNLKTNSWREVDIQLNFWFQNQDQNGVLVREKLYWLNHTKREGSFRSVLLSYDLVTDSFLTQIILPDVSDIVDFDTAIIDLMGSLACYVKTRDDFDSSRVAYDIWVMEEDDDDGSNIWRKKLSVGPFPATSYFTGMCTDGDFLMRSTASEFLMGNKNSYFLYDPLTKEEKKHPFSDIPHLTLLTPICYFNESLAGFSSTD